ncbi:hypothetical protein PRIPAC_90047 [Pristionchus pacificus]|uniref:Uncharacterized protein n=1 Tax=Pristionchus pacificus TaxID=54126 RepID=A0A2A6CXQ0_PRIPA|nr:hypothetical protein PRIPAC_90047 [Pristionchus pacificus]|eukprot:PDM82801.1 hypothetical protein PRIPAC_37194 [Pristionchus pacificus]
MQGSSAHSCPVVSHTITAIERECVTAPVYAAAPEKMRRVTIKDRTSPISLPPAAPITNEGTKIPVGRPKITLTLPAMNSPTPYGYVMMPTSAVMPCSLAMAKRRLTNTNIAPIRPQMALQILELLCFLWPGQQQLRQG